MPGWREGKWPCQALARQVASPSKALCQLLAVLCCCNNVIHRQSMTRLFFPPVARFQIQKARKARGGRNHLMSCSCLSWCQLLRITQMVAASLHQIPHPAQEHETHLAVLAGKTTTLTTMSALKTATRATIRSHPYVTLSYPIRLTSNLATTITTQWESNMSKVIQVNFALIYHQLICRAHLWVQPLMPQQHCLQPQAQQQQHPLLTQAPSSPLLCWSCLRVC